MENAPTYMPSAFAWLYAETFATLWLTSRYHIAGTTYLALKTSSNVAKTNLGQHNPIVLPNKYQFSLPK